VLTSEFGYSSGSGGQIRLILWQHSVLGRMSLLNLIGPRPGEDFSGSTWRSEGGLGTTVLTSVIQHSLGSAGLNRLTLWKHSGLGRTSLLALVGPRPGQDCSGSTWRSEGGKKGPLCLLASSGTAQERLGGSS